MVLRLGVGEHEAEATELYRSVANQPLQNFRDEEATERVVPGDPARSGVVVRMSRRGPREQMPPLASELVDEAGVELVASWISSLSAGESGDSP
jgi:mono/diheme cytochrome c family protein